MGLSVVQLLIRATHILCLQIHTHVTQSHTLCLQTHTLWSSILGF
jgi:hypothetical protein